MPGLRSPPSLLPPPSVTAALFSLSADLRDRPVLVVGGGALAERRTEALLVAGARPLLGAATLTPALAARVAAGRVVHLSGVFDPDWLQQPLWLLIAASDDAAVNRAAAAAGNAQRLLVDLAGPSHASAVPAPTTPSPIQPTTRLRAALSALRLRLRRDRPAAPPTLALARPQGTLAAGSVTLVGAGPGDPGLLTLNAARALAEADVILHDRLVSEAVLRMASAVAERIAVGKAAGGRGVRQEQTHALMLEHARRGRRVVRLKGGDPFVFGRGGEELEFLRAHAISYSVVPGITAALACAAYAGVPLTHRDHAQSLRLVTAHCKDSLDTLDWPALGRGRQTLAFYMGVAGLEAIQQRLLDAGRDAATAFALIENGSRPEQRVVTGSLATLAATARRHAVRAPALLIVGDVAALATHLHWFGQLPLTAASPSVAPASPLLADAA